MKILGIPMLIWAVILAIPVITHAHAKGHQWPLLERLRFQGILSFLGTTFIVYPVFFSFLYAAFMALIFEVLIPASWNRAQIEFDRSSFLGHWLVIVPTIWIGMWFFTFWVARLMLRYNQWRYEPGTRRGAFFADWSLTSWLRKVAKRRPRTNITFASLPLSVADEVKHFKIIGQTGTGKSTIIREMIDAALESGDRVVCADPDGGYLSTFYNPARGDVILNPFDARSARWSVLEELDELPDVQMLAESLVPMRSPGAKDDEWRGYARTFIAALLMRCRQEGGTAQDFYDLAVSSPVEDLATLLDGTPAAPFLSGPNARMFGSIRAVTSSALSSLQYANAARAGESFSVRRFISEGDGCLWLPYQATQIASLRDLISAWMRISMIETMNQEPDHADQRIWFIIDELDAIGSIAGLKDSTVRIRKFDGRVVIGFQSIAQVRAIYGDEDASTIVENLSNAAILRCSASEGGGTAKFASDLIGEREESRFTFNIGADGDTSLHQQIDTNSLVMPSEIEQLPDLAGYVKLTSGPAWHKIDFPPYPLREVAPRFVPRRFGFSNGGGRLPLPNDDRQGNAIGHATGEIIRMPTRVSGSDIRSSHDEDS